MAETTSSGQTRASIILAAVTRRLNERRALIDHADDLGELCITVKLMAGTTQVKSVSVSEEHVVRRSV